MKDLGCGGGVQGCCTALLSILLLFRGKRTVPSEEANVVAHKAKEEASSL